MKNKKSLKHLVNYVVYNKNTGALIYAFLFHWPPCNLIFVFQIPLVIHQHGEDYRTDN